tara:strand:+ start:3061 stop:3492 length:432 start_codon:yes stop_codon:yes gene_type:complete
MKKVLLFLFTISTFYGCDTELIEDCLFFQAKPRMYDISRGTAEMNTTYFSEIVGYVKNHDNDNFEYEFEIDGSLPPGIRHLTDGNSFKLYGAPTQTGVFTFDVTLTISQDENIVFNDDSDSNDICYLNTHETKAFTVAVLDKQ